MRAKWQSSLSVGDADSAVIKGNRRPGDGLVTVRESLLDLKPQNLLGARPPAAFLFVGRLRASRRTAPGRRRRGTGPGAAGGGRRGDAGRLANQRGRKGNRARKPWRAAGVSFVQAFVLTAILVEPLLGSVRRVELPVAVLVIAFIIGISVVLDVVGVAAAAADEEPFHAMAAKRIPGSRQSIALVRQADRVATFAVDLVGEATAAISGAAGAAIVFRLVNELGWGGEAFASTVIIGLIAAVTVGAKAWVKGFAIAEANNIVFVVGKILYVASLANPLRLVRRREPKRPRRRGE